MTNREQYLESAKQIIDLVNKNLELVSKMKFEIFKDFYLLYVELPNSILNITIRDCISVDVDNKLRQYKLDFYNNTRYFKKFTDFEVFFRSLDKSLTDRSTGIFIEYKGELYRCEVEISSFDSDRQMGLEVLYDIKFYDDELDEDVVALEVSEYPVGFFSIYDTNPDVSFKDVDVLRYFQKQNEEDERPDHDF